MKNRTTRKTGKGSVEINTLEIKEKKVDIKMKQLEMRNNRIALDLLEPRKIAISEQHILVEKISELRAVLSEEVIDEERTVFGGEPIYKSMLDPNERKTVKKKLQELIEKL